jgi:peptidoglycan/xylan/chitin deacetylase (PgdA/CDA1 family)
LLPIGRIRPGSGCPVVLMYHRVAALRSDPWGLAVAPATFEKQLKLLARHRTVLPLAELIALARSGTAPRNAVAISFDDGYADNFTAALPLLARLEMPAAFFVTTDPIDRRRPFWWDELAELILERRSPADVTLDAFDDRPAIRFGEIEPQDEQRGTWRAWETPRTAREHCYVLLWERLRAQSTTLREQAMTEIAERLGAKRSSRLEQLSPEQLGALARHPLAAIGGHTVSHPDLRKLSPAEQFDEIAHGKVRLEALCGRPIEGFAYPHGLFSEVTKQVAREAGFAWACTTQGAAVPEPVDCFAVPRLTIGDLPPAMFGHLLGSH